MWEAATRNPADLARGNEQFRGTGLDTVEIIAALQEVCPGIHADWGSRHGLWHPGQNEVQGLFYFHQHLCSIDRGIAPQWPVWDTEESLVEVPVAYAVAHEDFPVMNIQEMDDETDSAMVMRSVLNDVQKVGWAEVFWRLLHHNLPGITREFLEDRFNVSLAWMDEMQDSPIIESYNQAEARGFI